MAPKRLSHQGRWLSALVIEWRWLLFMVFKSILSRKQVGCMVTSVHGGENGPPKDFVLIVLICP